VPRLEFRVKAADDPLGATLATLDESHLQAGSSFRKVKLGTGSGQVVLPAQLTEALQLHHEAHVQVVDTTLGNGSTPAQGLLGSFFLGDGDAKVLSESKDRRQLSWGGEGSLAILARAALLESHYAPGQPVRGSAQIPGMWTWYNIAAGGVMTRATEEGQNQPGTPLADVAASFDRLVSTDLTPWTIIPELIERPWGTNVLDLLSDFVKQGLIPQMSGNLIFDLHETYGRDLAGAFAPNTVRFQAKVNIAADLNRAIRSKVAVSHLFVVGSNNVTVVVEDLSVFPRAYGVMNYSSSDDPAVLTAVGQRDLAMRKLQTDVPRFPILTGFDPENGAYTPGPPGSSGHVWVGDTVRLHTGTDAHHYDEVDFPVAALTWTLNSARKWEVTVELGASYLTRQKREFEENVQQIIKGTYPSPHSHPEMLCPVPTVGFDTGVMEFATGDGVAMPWHYGGESRWGMGSPTLGDGSQTGGWAPTGPTGYDGANGSCFWGPNAAGGTSLSPRYTANPGEVWELSSWIWTEGSGLVWMGLDFGKDNPGGGFTILQTESLVEATGSGWMDGGGGTSVAPADTEWVQVRGCPTILTWRGYDHTRLRVLNAAGPNTGVPELIGTGTKASRCDHRHHVLQSGTPTSAHDEAAGYPPTTLWTDTSTGAHFLHMGAGVWEPFGQGVTEHGDLDGLTDPDHPASAITETTDGDVQTAIDLLRGTIATVGSTRWQPHVDWEGHVVLNALGDPVMIEVSE
jgi:hypothetical protein